MKRGALLLCTLTTTLACGAEPPGQIGRKLSRVGDEIMVCGQLYHTTTRVVLWTDPGGYDAYRVEPRFAPLDQAPAKATDATKARPPRRYRLRSEKLSADEIERVRGGGWDLPLLARVVDQFVIHFDARGTSRGCFQVLQDVRGLSVHFMLDLDGTIYQTLDVKEGAHACHDCQWALDRNRDCQHRRVCRRRRQPARALVPDRPARCCPNCPARIRPRGRSFAGEQAVAPGARFAGRGHSSGSAVEAVRFHARAI